MRAATTDVRAIELIREGARIGRVSVEAVIGRTKPGEVVTVRHAVVHIGLERGIPRMALARHLHRDKSAIDNSAIRAPELIKRRPDFAAFVEDLRKATTGG